MDQFVPEHERVRMMAAAGIRRRRLRRRSRPSRRGSTAAAAEEVGAGWGIIPRAQGPGSPDPTAPSSQDDIYEQYKKRMSTGYRYRPNPLGTRASSTTS